MSVSTAAFSESPAGHSARSEALFSQPLAAQEGQGEERPAKRLRSSPLQPACQECGKKGPGYVDETDNNCYCADCWLAFYGQLPTRAVKAEADSPTQHSLKLKEAFGQGGKEQESQWCQDSSGLVLPEDAPMGHAAHTALHIGGTATALLVRFNYRVNGQLINFQTTAVAAGNSRHAAEVICRACYVKFEEGWNKDQVLKFRGECYARLKNGRLQAPPRRQSLSAVPCSQEASRQQVAAPSQSHRSSVVKREASSPQAPAPAVSSLRGEPRLQAASVPQPAPQRSSAQRAASLGAGQTPSSAPTAKRGAGIFAGLPPLQVRSLPCPSSLAGGSQSQSAWPAAVTPSGWAPSGYLQNLLDDPSNAPPAPANEPRQQASPPAPKSHPEVQASARSSGSRQGAGLRLTAASPEAAAEPRPAPEQPRREPSPCNDFMEALGLSSPQKQPEARPAAGPGEQRQKACGLPWEDVPRAAPRAQQPAEEEEDSQRPTPQLSAHTPAQLQGSRNDRFEPTPQLDKPTPWLTLPTPFDAGPLLCPPADAAKASAPGVAAAGRRQACAEGGMTTPPRQRPPPSPRETGSQRPTPFPGFDALLP